MYFVMVLLCVGGTYSAPMDVLNFGDSENRIKRSPLAVGYASFDKPTHHNVLVEYGSTIIQNPPNYHHVESPYPSSSIKSSSIHGSSNPNGADINLVKHEIIQTHDHPKELHIAEEIIADIRHLTEHELASIRGPPAISSSRKTTVTNKVQHIIDEKGVIPIVTQDVTHTQEHVHHVKEDESLRVLPLHAPYPTHLPIIFHHTRSTHNIETTTKSARERRHQTEDLYRKPIGGFGQVQIGGHGAGHGYYVNNVNF